MPDRRKGIATPSGGWKSEPDRSTRVEQYGKGHFFTCDPPCDGVEYMQPLMFEMGAGRQGDSLTPADWQDVNQYDQAIGLGLSSWERATLIAMSRAFVGWVRKGNQQGNDPGDEVPYILDTPETRAQAGRNMAEAAKRGRKKIDEALDG